MPLIKRLSLDLAMIVLILVEFAYRLTGSTVHELIGVSMFALFVVHGAWNWGWFVALGKGRYAAQRVASTTINALLLATALLMVVSGLLNSQLLFALTQVELDLLPRELHTAAAYGVLILIGVHLGMHWKLIMAETGKLAGASWTFLPRRLRWASQQVAAVAIAAYGVAASFERSVWSRLTAYYSFGNWEFDESVAGFFAQYVAIVGLYAVLAHYGLQLVKQRSRPPRPAIPSRPRSCLCRSRG